MGKLNRKTNSPSPEGKSEEKSVGKTVTINPVLAYQREQLDEIAFRDREVAKVFRETSMKKARPTKLTEEIIQQMEILARIGLSEKAMAESVGISEKTFFNWKEKNVEFRTRINKARNTGKAKLLNSLYGHGLKNWQAIAWLLERQYRSEFALDKQKVELAGQDGGPITFRVVYVDKPEGV